MTQNVPEDDDQAHCRECCLAIPSGALKCIECGTFQDWRRFLTFSSSFLSLTIALISVITVCAPIILDTFSSAAANLKVTPVSLIPRNITQDYALQLRGEGGITDDSKHTHAGGKFLQLLVVNSGSRAGSVVNVEVQGKDIPGFVEGPRWMRMVILGEKRPGPVIIPAGNSRILTAFYHSDRRGSMESCTNYDRGRVFPIRITVVGADGVVDQIELSDSVECKWDYPML